MSGVFFLDEAIVLTVHWDQIDRYGGSPDIRDLGLLSSALAVPRSSFDGERLHGDLFDMRAAYMYHIIQNHPFVDGNKRTGTVSAIIFLNLNGADIDVSNEMLERMAFGVASGEMSKEQLTELFQQHATALESE